MKQERILKAQSICQKIISEYFSEHLHEETSDFWIITVTGVIISSELSYMDVSISSLRNEEQLTKALSNYAPEIQKILWKKIDFIKVPKVRFRYDDTGKNSFHIYQQIKNLDN
jgi:ribosome-binding factor A